MKTIIPEVMDRKIKNKENSNYSIHLSKTDNNQTYNKVNNNNIDNSTTINNPKSKGVARLMFDIITFPIVLIYRIIKYPFVRYEIKNNYKKYKLLYANREKTKKLLRKVEKMQGFNDEIF